MSDNLPEPSGEFLLYTGQDGKVKVECRFQDETLWLTQRLMAELFGVGVPAINKHLKNIFESGELEEVATISKIKIIRSEEKQEVRRVVDFYNLDAIIAVGYRVNSYQATQFRIWATRTLKEFIIKVPRVGAVRRIRVTGVCPPHGGGFELRIAEVDPVFDEMHQADQPGAVALQQAALAGDLEDRQRQPYQQLGDHRQRVAEVAVAQHQRIEQPRRVPDPAVAGAAGIDIRITQLAARLARKLPPFALRYGVV